MGEQANMHRTLPLILVASLSVGCAQVDRPPILTAEQVDLERFMGDWFVIASIPTFIEKRAVDALETYELAPDGRVLTTFSFVDEKTGKSKRYNPVGFVRPDTGNAVWGMQFIWPIKAEYRILYVDDAYDYTVIGRTARDYVWIMARSADITDARYAELVKLVEDEGYDISTLRRVPHSSVDP